MTARVMAEARTRLASLLDAEPSIAATVTPSATEARSDGAVVFVGDASAGVEPESLQPGQARYVYAWSVELLVRGRQYHPDAASAQDEVTAIIDAIDVYLADNPELIDSSGASVAGLESVAVSSMTCAAADMEDAGRWEAAGVVGLAFNTRKR